MEINRNTIIKDLIKSSSRNGCSIQEVQSCYSRGVRGPNEPIAFFAKAHEVDYDTLVKELNEAIGKERR